MASNASLSSSANAKKQLTSAPQGTPTSSTQPLSTLGGGFKLGAPATTTVSATSAPALGGTSGGGLISSFNAATSTSGGGLTLGGGTTATTVPQMSFSQLEDSINKWTSELCEEERNFLTQATQINAWDKAINANETRLTQLHDSVKQVEDQQTRINYDLDFIAAQLHELETSLVPLEKEAENKLISGGAMPNTIGGGEPQRKQLYLTATSVDSQMKRLSDDLKEVIEHINETSRGTETLDPVLQVGRVLNSHMESLQFIDNYATKIQECLDTLSKQYAQYKTESDASPRDI